MADSSMLKRSFRNVALISGLAERRLPGQEKTARQMTVSTDLIYDVLRQHEPDHVLLQINRAAAAEELLDLSRLEAFLRHSRDRIVHQDLPRISPLAVPVIAEAGREMIYGAGVDALLAEADIASDGEALLNEARAGIELLAD